MTSDQVEVNLPAGTVLKLTGIPIELLTPTKITTSKGNWELLQSWGVIFWEKKKVVEKKEVIVWEETY